MGAPQVDVTLKEGGPPVPGADITGIVHVVGPTSLGTADTPATIGTEADLAAFGFGPAVRMAGAALAAGGNPVYLTKSATSAAGANGSVTKTDPSDAVGTPTVVGNVTYTALGPGVTVQHVVAGNNTPLTIPALGAGIKAIVVNVATDGGGLATSTQTLIAAALAAQATAAALATAATGAGIATAAGATALPFGSTAALVASGTPVDRFDVVFYCSTAGALGTARGYFSLDAGADQSGGTFSPEKLIPVSGIVSLNDSRITSGIVATLTGVLAVGDTWRWTTTAPTSNSTAVNSAAAAAINDQTRLFSFFGFATPFDSAFATAVKSTIDTAALVPQYKWLLGLASSRDANAGEAAATWRDAVNADLNGATPFASSFGRITILSGACRMFDKYTQRYYRTTPVFAGVARKVARPVHEDLGRRKTGAVDNVLSLYHDETLNSSFSNNRQISMYSRGGIYFTRSNTMADGSSRYNRLPVAAVLAQSAKILCDLGNQEILNSLVTNPTTGAISDEEARAIESVLEAGLRQFLFSPKKDGKVSATPPAPGEKMVVVLQNYNYASVNELRVEGAVKPVGYNDAVKIGLTLQIPG